MSNRRGQRVVFAAVVIGVVGGVAGSAVYVWGPMHATYEQVCEALPFLRAVGPVPLSLLATAIFAGLVAAALTVLQVLHDSHRISRYLSLARLSAPPRLLTIADSLDLGHRCVLIDDAAPYAFCHGFIAPRVYVTSGLFEVLDNRELRAVLAHERAHLRSHDPLRISIGRTLSRLFLFAPLHEEVYRAYRLRRELLADRAAVQATDLRDLASALLKTLQTGGLAPRSEATAAFGHLRERIEALTGETSQDHPPIPWGRGVGQAALRSSVTLVVFAVLLGVNQEAVLGCLI